MALHEAGGSVCSASIVFSLQRQLELPFIPVLFTRAAKLLGLGQHQILVSLLNGRHKNLLYARRPVVRRKRSLTRSK